ncbi:MAG: protein kinase domain-containing protein [Kofleriaceae bacterium]
MRPSSEPSARRSAGRYVLGDLLGRGGMAEVFAGHSMGDHGFQKPVAIKRLLPELASDHVFVERLIEEAKLLVGMQHGNIVSVLDLARDGDDVFLVMEFVDGPSLRQLLKARGPRGVSYGTATYIVQAAAAGLEFAHNRPGGAIIHADISPSNLLLTTSGEVRVADFGIARREGGGHGIVEGKWAYMAPEQARGEPLTPRSDVFALGVVLYELICGAHPFGRQVTHEERDSHPMRVIAPRVVKPSVPPGLDAICMRALAHDPRDRYRSMQQLIDAILDERFANHWREGASDLAHAIREGAGHSRSMAIQQPRTLVTDRPVTIMTRSLLRELTPVRRAPSRPSTTGLGTPPPEAVSHAVEPVSRAVEPVSESAAIPPSGAQTQARYSDELARAAAAALLEIPPALRSDGPPLPQFTFAPAAGPDLEGVVGGHTMTGHTMTGHAIAVEPRSPRWAIGVLGLAALAGVVAAVLIQLSPSETRADAAPSRAAIAPLAATASSQPVAPVEAPVAPPVAAKVEAPSTAEVVAPPTTPSAKLDPPPGPTVAELADPVEPVEPAAPKEEPRRSSERPAPRASQTAKKREPGYLRFKVKGQAWAWATVPGHPTQETLGLRLSLAPGRYAVKLANQSKTKAQTRFVTIESGRTHVLTHDFGEDDE